MITKKANKQDELIFLTLEELVPEDHLVRALDEALDFNFIYKAVDGLYSTDGRPGIDPVVLFKVIIIKQVFQIRSLRQTMRDIEVNLAYRWFLRIPLSEKVPDFTTISKNFNLRFNKDGIGLDILKNLFQQILDHKLVPAKELNLEEFKLQIAQSIDEEPKVHLDEKALYPKTLV